MMTARELVDIIEEEIDDILDTLQDVIEDGPGLEDTAEDTPNIVRVKNYLGKLVSLADLIKSRIGPDTEAPSALCAKVLMLIR